MTINLLPWRESLHARRKQFLVIVFTVTILGLVFAVLVCRVLMTRQEAAWGEETERLQNKVVIIKGLGQQIQPEQSNEDNLLRQIQTRENDASLNRVNDPVWLSWLRDGLAHRRLQITSWLAAPGQIEIHLQISDHRAFSGLVAKINEFSWQMAEFKTNGEVMNVVIRTPAVDRGAI